MEPRDNDDRQERQPDRPEGAGFHIEKLEERIAPSFNPAVSITPSGNIQVLPHHHH